MIKRLTLLMMLLQAFILGAQNEQDLYHLGSYETGIAESAEVVAYDAASQQVFFTSAGPNLLTILDVSNPGNPDFVKEVDLSPYGGGPNSVAVKNGLVAVAVEADPKTDPGFVVFFDTDGNWLKTVEVGYLPDMIAFNPDGTKVYTANEGEPNDDYTIDPPGSISILNVAGGVNSITVQNIGFAQYNDKKIYLQNKGIRIFGNNGLASVAQDLEPEYISFSPDGQYVYVNCQEANGFIVLDGASNEILDILPLGYKNHYLGSPSVKSTNINEVVANWPELGTPLYDGGQDPVQLGGFSGLYYSPMQSGVNNYVFYAVPDRGPNDATVSRSAVTPAASGNLRPFKLPDYQGRIVRFDYNRRTGAVQLQDQIMLFQKDGVTPISGKGNVPGVDEVPVTYADPNTPYNTVDYTGPDGEEYTALPYDPYGGDFEGILIDKDGNFWMCDEYRPSIYKFAPNGTLIERYVPEGTAALGTTLQPAGTYGAETLPAVYAKRRANRGFEAIAYDAEKNVVYAFIQSPIENPNSSVRNNSDVIRILGVSAEDGTPVEEYVYLLERNRYAGLSSSRVDKIGDAVYMGDGKFLVLERDSEGPGVTEGKKYIYEINLKGATNTMYEDVARRDGSNGSPTLEEYSGDQLALAGIKPVHKTKVLNLPSVNYVSSDKAEGLAILPNNEIAVLNDNDFGLAGAGITDNSVLGLISFNMDYGFDASNRDDAINIMPHPTLGMYLPDAIASYQAADGKTYIVTANEGDSRDYDGYSEEERVKDLNLDPVAYPDPTLQDDENLGRLKTTTADGDYDGDGLYDQIYSYGGRSFSIFDVYGNLVYDSGSDFGRSAALFEPALFNNDEGEKDGRSDDKGVEPEAVTVGTIGDYTYAFVGFERQSAIVVYDITNPFSPEFITYYQNSPDGVTGDVSPEIIKFVAADDSPNGENLLVVGYEVSGSVGIIQVGGELTSISEEIAANDFFDVYPNPTVHVLNLSETMTGIITDANGVVVNKFNEVNQINVSNLAEGMYTVTVPGVGSKRFVKL